MSGGARSPNERLVQKLRTLPKVRVQNSLMRQADRPLALAIKYMEEEDRAFLFSHLPRPKIQRIEEELRLQKRLKITYEQYTKAVMSVIDAMDSDSGKGTLKSYIRPKDRNRGR